MNGRAQPALSEFLLRKEFKTKSRGSNLDRQIARWKNGGLPFKTVFRLVLALEKPASALLPAIESMEEEGVAAKPVLGLKNRPQKTERAEEAIVVAESLASSRSGTAKLPVRVEWMKRDRSLPGWCQTNPPGKQASFRSSNSERSLKKSSSMFHFCRLNLQLFSNQPGLDHER